MRAGVRAFVLFIMLGCCDLSSIQAACDVQAKPTGFRFPVVVTVPKVFEGTPVEEFVGWSYKGNIWKKILIQVDEKNAEGSFVLENGMPYTKNTDDGLADSNDEISLRGLDLGEFFNMEKLTPSLLDTVGVRQRLDVCVQNAYAGSILLARSKNKPKTPEWSPFFNPSKSTINTSAYRYLFNQKRPMLVGEVFLKSNGSEYPVFADSTFVMPMIPSFWFLPGMKFDENDFTSEVECWRQGPVRTIVAVGAKLSKFFSIVKLHLFSELIFYEDFFQIPTQIEMVFDANKFLSYGSGLAYILRYPAGGRWDVSTNLAPLPKDSNLGGGPDDSPSVTAKQHSPQGVFRAWGSRPEGSFLAQVRVDKKAIERVPPPFLIQDKQFKDTDYQKSWKWLKGNQGDLGVFLDISQVRKGIYDFTLDLMLSPRANDGFADFRSVQGEWASLSAK